MPHEHFSDVMSARVRISLSIVFTILIVTIFSYFYITTYFSNQILEEQRDNVTSEATILQNNVSYFYHQKNKKQINTAMALLDAQKYLIQAFLFDNDNRVLASSKAGFIGKQSVSIFPKKISDALASKQKSSNERLKTKIWLTDNEESIFAFVPILANDAAESSKNQREYLFLQYNKKRFINDKKQLILSSLAPIVLLLIVIVIALSYYFYSSIGMRVHQLKMVINKFLLDNGQLVKTLSENDELNALKSSFHHMTDWLSSVHKKLFDSREYLKILLNSIAEGIIATDKNGHIVRINPAAERLTYWRKEDVHNIAINKVLRLYDLDDKSELIEPFESVFSELESSKSFEALLITENKCEFIINFSVSPIHHNRLIDGVVIVMRDITETHNLLKTIIDTEKNYKNLFNLSRDGYVINKGNGEILEPNPAYAKMLGYSCEDLVKESWRDLTPKKWADWEIENHGKQLVERGYTDLYEKEYIHKNGDLVAVEIQAFLLNSSDNLDEATIGAFVRNITKRKENNEYLRQYKYILSSSSDLIALINKEYQFKAVNDAFSFHFNLSAEQLLGKTVATVIGKRNFNEYLKENVDSSLNGNVTSLKMWAKFQAVGKRYIDVTCSPYRSEQNTITGVVINARDITQQKYSDDEIVAKKIEQDHILDSLVDAVITMDEKGVVQGINHAGEDLFGYCKDEIIGRNINVLIWQNNDEQHDDSIYNYLAEGEKKIEGLGREIVGQRKNLTTFPFQFYVSELPFDEKRCQRFVGTCHDLTYAKNQEQKALRSQKMDALGKLTGGIAHDFNNMLGVILGYCEVLDKQLIDQPRLANYVNNISIAGQRGADLTRKLLSFSKKTHTHKNIINVNQLIASQENILQKSVTALIDLKLTLHDDLWDVNIDISSFDDMLLNICINAMQAMPNGGDITIKTENVILTNDDMEYSGLIKGKYIVLSIEDTGCGINDDDKDKIFEPFFTTKGDEGTGLGLSQVYGFVNSSGGTIKVESVVNKGSKFIFYFPCSALINKTDIQNQSTNFSTKLCDTSKVILVVDDESQLCELAREMLTQQGFTVYVALSGKEALEVLKSQKIDVMISDVIMPKMNGYELSNNVTMLYPSVKILLASGFQRDLAEQDMHRKASLQMISKPYSVEALLKGIQTCFVR